MLPLSHEKKFSGARQQNNKENFCKKNFVATNKNTKAQFFNQRGGGARQNFFELQTISRRSVISKGGGIVISVLFRTRISFSFHSHLVPVLIEVKKKTITL